MGLQGFRSCTMSFLADGLPPLGERNVSITESGGNAEKHESATCTVKPLNLLANGLVLAPSAIWMEADLGMRWATEDDIKIYVRNVLTDTLRILDLHKLVHVQAELNMFGNQKADFYYLRQKTAPIGVVEVKKPGGGGFDTQPLVLGQIYDYLLALKQFQGLEHVYGILTSYEEWRICWLSDSDEHAITPTTIPEMNSSNHSFTIWDFLPPIPTWQSTQHVPELPLATGDFSPPQNNRKFSCSASYRWNDSNLPKILATAVCKMASSRVTPPTFESISNKRFALCPTPDKYIWSTRPSKKVVNFEVFPDASSEDFYLLADLHGGSDGHAWLACSSSGRGCVVKSYEGSDCKQMADSESRLWNSIWGTSTFVRRCLNNYFLVMPYVRPVSVGSEPPTDPAILAATKVAIRRMARMGYLHQDLKWAHVGLYRSPDKNLHAVLFDLARVAADCEESIAVTEMFAALNMQENIGDPLVDGAQDQLANLAI